MSAYVGVNDARDSDLVAVRSKVHQAPADVSSALLVIVTIAK